MSGPRIAAMLGACALFMASQANAALISVGTANCGGFNTCDDSDFLSVTGGPLDVFIDFETDRFGNPIVQGNGPIAGDAFSNLVTFSSEAGTFGGGPSTDVDYGVIGGTAEIGPLGNFTGILAIDFLDPVSAFGFGTVELEIIETISLFDPSNNQIGLFGGVSDQIFDYFGVIGTAGEQISRVELDGNFFAIQNLQFSAAAPTAVPEPESLALIGLGLAAMGLWTRRRQSARRSTAAG